VKTTQILSGFVASGFWGAGGLLAAAALASGVAHAQGAPAVAPAMMQPAPPPPSGPFPPPPPRHDGQPPPFDYPFSADQRSGAPPGLVAGGDEGGGFRRFSATAAFGPGILVGPGERSLAMSYQLIRLGIGLDRNLALMFGFSGVGTSSVNPKTGNDSWLKQEVWSLGLQGNLLPRFYVRGGLGTGHVSESAGGQTFSGGRGLEAEGAVGYELLQRRHVALAVELNGSWTHYSRESWKTAGLQMSVSLF
jgi:hypothetical protein